MSGFNEFANLNNARSAGDAYRYFGQQPYWTEKGGMGPESNALDWYQMYGY